MFNDKELVLLNNAFRDTWQAICVDVLALSMNDEISKDYLIEVVDDADKIETYGNLDKNILKKFKALNYNSRIKLLKDHFIFDIYGY